VLHVCAQLQDEEPPIHAGLRHMDGTRPVAPAVAAGIERVYVMSTGYAPCLQHAHAGQQVVLLCDLSLAIPQHLVNQPCEWVSVAGPAAQTPRQQQTAASIKHPAPCMALPTPCLRTPGCVATCLRCTAGPTAAADEGALPTVGDGGASWRLKALKRAQQLAAEQGKDAATVSCCYCCCSNMHVDGGLHERVAGNRRKAHMYVLATAHAPTLTAVAQKPGICSTQHALTCGAVLWQLLKCKLCPFSGVLLLTLLQFISERWGSTAELTKALTSGGSAAHGGRPQQVAHGACLAQPQLAVMFNDVPHPLHCAMCGWAANMPACMQRLMQCVPLRSSGARA
jgi:hypothetical protein